MKRVILSVLIAAAILSAQKPGASTMPECRGPKSKDHPCSCATRTHRLMAEAYEACRQNNASKKATMDCVAAIPMHCEMIEKYGNWHTNEKGEHDEMMSEQCSMACTRGHCKCDAIFDGETCHIAHSPRDDPK